MVREDKSLEKEEEKEKKRKENKRKREKKRWYIYMRTIHSMLQTKK